MASPQQVVTALADRHLTIATGESLTAGLVAATLADVPGCSAVLVGGVVAYDPALKASLLHVTDHALAHGVVSEQVAMAMAQGARLVTGADIGVATTGVAGPQPHDGQAVGTVWIAVDPGRAVLLQLSGDRDQIRRQTVEACWRLVLESVGTPDGEGVPPGGE